MRYSAADKVFTHQLPQPFDQVHHPDPTSTTAVTFSPPHRTARC